LGIAASKKGAALLEGMVHAGSTCLRRVADGERRSEVRFNRFLANPKVTVERLVAGWSEATGAAVVGRHVLAIQDTSEINFRTTRTRTRGLGEIGKGVGRGALLHAMVAVDAESRRAWAWLPARFGRAAAGLVCRTGNDRSIRKNRAAGSKPPPPASACSRVPRR
jgi:hypothetical protein